MLNTPRGSPASFAISPSAIEVSGASSDGFSTQLFPAARQGPRFHVASISGEFHGMMIAPTPTGGRSVKFTSFKSRPRNFASLCAAS